MLYVNINNINTLTKIKKNEKIMFHGKILNHYHNITFKIIINKYTYENNDVLIKKIKIIYKGNMNKKEEIILFNRFESIGIYEKQCFRKWNQLWRKMNS